MIGAAVAPPNAQKAANPRDLSHEFAALSSCVAGSDGAAFSA